MNKNIVIIGGGIIGLCTAYYLQKEGCNVTIIDKSEMNSGASYVNAGYITPSHFIPLATPGIITKGIKWMLDSSSPFYVKPRLDLDFLKWSLAFKKSATKQKVAKAIKPILDINLFGRDLYEDLKTINDFNFHYEKKGLFMLYKSDKVGEEEWEVGKIGIQQGLKVENLSKKQVEKIEPNANLDIKGAVYFHSDGHMTPNLFMKEMISYLESNRVLFYKKEEVVDLQLTSKKITKVVTNKREIEADEVVLAAGSWSPLITKKLGLKIPIQAGKGYSLNIKSDTKITMPSILCEEKVAVTPMQGFTRFAGTMEIGGINHKINTKRVEAIANAGKRYYKNLEITSEEKENVTCGLRPCSPDGLPYIGKSEKCKNLTIATGHAMMGWSLGPATGKLVTEIISGKSTSVNIASFHPDRKF